MVFGFGRVISIGIMDVKEKAYQSRQYSLEKSFKFNRVVTIGGTGSDIVQKGADNLQCALYYTGIKLWLENIGKKTMKVGVVYQPDIRNANELKFRSKELGPLQRTEVVLHTTFTFGDESKEYTITKVPS